MPTNELELKTKTLRVPDAECETLPKLTEYLQLMEETLKEVVGVGILQLEGGDANIVDYVVRPDGVNLEQLEVVVAEDENAVREKLQTHTAVQWAVMKINGNPKNVLVARKGRSLVWRGMISTFGGPGDTGMTSGEPLAIIRDGDITPGSKIAALFENGTGPALGRRLRNTDRSYIACRWDYKTTPRTHLLAIEVEVRNPVTGKSIKAQPADWGPAEWTNRVADLSDFAANELGLKTNDVCEVIVPLPALVAGPPAPTAAKGTVRAALVGVARDQYQRYHGMQEANEPMLSRIKGYWDELKADAGNEFTFKSATEVPWSAVFVCWCLKQAGVTNAQFRFSRQHSVYIHAAIGRAKAQPAQIYPALDAQVYAPVPGDIIHWNRNGGTVTYAGAAGNNDYESHCVIVVDVGQDNRGPCAITVGGNENQSVGQNRLPLSADGRLVPRSGNPYISIIKMA